MELDLDGSLENSNWLKANFLKNVTEVAKVLQIFDMANSSKEIQYQFLKEILSSYRHPLSENLKRNIKIWLKDNKQYAESEEGNNTSGDS